MLKLLGADSSFTAIRNLAPVLGRLLAVADHSDLYLGFSDPAHRRAILELPRALTEAPRTVAPRWVGQRGANPLGGRFGEYPILAALLEPLTQHETLVQHTRVLLVGIALSADQPGAIPRLNQIATQLRLATDFKDARQELLLRLYAAPHRGLSDVGRLRRRTEALLTRKRSPLTGGEKDFVSSLRHLSTLYSEQWARLQPTPPDLPEARLVMLDDGQATDDGLGGRIQLGFLESFGEDGDDKAEDETEGDERAEGGLLVQEAPRSPDSHLTSPPGLDAAVRRAAGSQRYRARPIPWSDGLLNPFERARLVNHLEQAATLPWSLPASGAALLAGLVLALGRDLVDVLMFDVGPGSGFSQQGVHRHPAPCPRLARSRAEDQPAAGNGAETYLSLTLPPVVERLLASLPAGDSREPLAQRLGLLSPKDWAKAVAVICAPALPTGRRKATPARLRDSLRAALLRETHDPVCVYAITGSQRDAPMTGALYAAFPIDALEAIHRRVVQDVFATVPFPGER